MGMLLIREGSEKMNRDMIRRIQFDPALSAGARNATRVCLHLQPDEQLTLIADREELEIAAR
jgi:hypothetical protein